MTAPWLSVIVPTFNGAAYLPIALDSVLTQSSDGLEVIAVDDGSTDGTLEILARYRNRLPLTVVERRVGNWAANSNLGLQQAHGEWACFLHQDDVWMPGRLDGIRPCLDRQPALVLHAANFIDASGRTTGRWTCPLPPGPAGSPPEKTVARLLVQNFVPLPAATFRRDDALRVGELDPDLWFTADWDLWLKLAGLGRTTYVPKALAAFRLHGQSQTVVRSGRSVEMRQQYQAVFDAHWPLWRDRLAASGRVAAAARLAREINVGLAARHHGEAVDWSNLSAAAAVGPGTWAYCLRNSRLLERVVGRLRTGLGSK